MKRRTFNVKFRLDNVLIEVEGITAQNWLSTSEQLAAASERALRLCLMKFTKEYRGMKIEYIGGRPRVVGVEASDAWPD